ncbi:hypothetical protein LCI18_013709 [Fusarium solani-melongenae]|uniref:Uncharacterized protein n=1 Tax=Fusarium solani subsp. cucurbitae TaxID=2747967 RepID=A0ACD3ZN47_FUSSC|nr:hypothetical protein LCI18_013709 [Fusarium solani-melongenae]
MERLDIVIIGAGWHGLAMAKTYLEVCPDASMAIFDGAASIGGTWAKERLYPGLKTNNLLGTYEFSDFPMTPGRFDVKEGQHIPGQAVHEYLTQFADHFYLTSRIQLRQKVETAELLEDGSWSLRVASTESETEPRTVVAKKLVVATGLTSEPFMPKFAGEKDFNRPFFHAKELRDRADEVENAREVVVLGGNKSAWDTCFFAAKTGAHVHMVMRPSGGGPSWVWPVLFSPWKVSVQRLAATRFFTWFDPCIWSESSGTVGWVRSALHGTRLGRVVVSKFWNTLQGFAEKAHRYDDHPETRRLRPWVSPFWMGNSLSIHNYASPWFDLVREGKITVHIANVSSLSDGTVHLSNGENLNVDAFVCCTGWATEPPVRFLPKEMKPELGLQRSNSIEDREMTEMARAEIFRRLPAVRGPPNRNLPPGTAIPISKAPTSPGKTSSGYQLYRFLVPSDEKLLRQRNIAFIGSHLALNATMIAQLQALWVTAFFVDELPHLTVDTFDHNKVRYETILHNEYSAIRHPHEAGGAGARCPDLAFDCLSYMDLLGNDLGLSRYRKYGRTGVWSEMFYRYGPSDFKGMVQEWLDKRRKASTYRN